MIHNMAKLEWLWYYISIESTLCVIDPFGVFCYPCKVEDHCLISFAMVHLYVSFCANTILAPLTTTVKNKKKGFVNPKCGFFSFQERLQFKKSVLLAF